MRLPPKRMTGNSALAQWCNSLLDFATANRIMQGLGYRVKESPTGTALEIRPGGGGGTPAAPLSVQEFFFFSSFKDYWLCTDGTGTTQYRVAKPHKLRNSISGEVIYGTAFNFSYPHNTGPTDPLYGLYRTATSGGLTENQGVVPPCLHLDKIYAITVPAIRFSEAADAGVPVNTPITLLDLNCDGRAWAAFQNQNF